jgi:hypothetical protein
LGIRVSNIDSKFRRWVAALIQMFVRSGSVVSRICFPTAPKRLLQQYRREADVTWAQRDVRFQGESGHDADWLSLPSLTLNGHQAQADIPFLNYQKLRYPIPF